MNNVNQITPEGSLRYDVTGNHAWTDPSTGQTYQIPTFTSTQSLSPQSQTIQDQLNAAKMNMAGMANTQSGRVSDLLSTPFSPDFNAQQYLQQNPDVMAYAQANGLDPMQLAAQHYQNYGQTEGRAGGSPTAGNAQNLANIPGASTSYDAGGQIQTGFGDAGDVTRSYGAGDFSQDRQNVEDSLMARMNPQLSRERTNVEQRLADQGIRAGSPAYAAAMDDYNRQSNDARFAAVSQAGQEQQRMMDMAAQRAGFQNSAQQQAYDQLMGRGTFANAAQAAQNAQNASAAGFRNSGLAQQLGQQQSVFNAQNAARNQYMQEQYAQRNQPINEITSLMSGSAVQSPNWLNSPTSQIPTTDIGGLINQNFAQQSQNYQSANQNWQTMMGGVLGLGGKLGGAAIMKSDRDVKENITKMGTVFSAKGVADVDSDEIKKLPVYEWSYKDDPASTRHVGPMAQDVEKIDKSAVKTIGGVKHIDTRKVMGNILRAA